MALPQLHVGDRVLVYGGYAMDPEWLASDPRGYVGRVVEFIPAPNERSAAVVELDDELVLPAGAGEESGTLVRGKFLVLRLGHVGTDWSTPTPRTHVELCDTRPEAMLWDERRKGAWVESHATYRIIDSDGS